MKVTALGLIFSTLYVCAFSQSFTFPANEYEFSIRRDALKQAERIFEGKSTDLTEDERIVDNYLQHLKWLEFKSTEDIGFPPARPIEEQMDYIKSTDVYKVLKKLPKGGNMHTHESHELSKRTFLDLIFDSDQFQYLYMVEPGYENEWTLDFFTFPPENQEWIHVPSSNYTSDDIYPHLVLTDTLNIYAKRYPSDSAERWKQMGPLWGRMRSPLGNLPIKMLYIQALYNQCLEEGIQYIEARHSPDPFLEMYVIDDSGDHNRTYGKRYLKNQLGALEINTTLHLLERFMEQHPEFIGHRRIFQASRPVEPDEINATLRHALHLHQKYPEHIIGFDLVGEEDVGNSHLFFLHTFLSLYDETTGQSKIPLWLHTTETNWPNDLISSANDLDPVGTLQNTYEAILYGARRVGHGLGFIKHPYLLNILKERQVAIETCPVSNQILGFIPDIRNHPAAHYLRAGVPIVLGADDPGTFGYNSFTVDWYEVFMAWGLDLAELKQLAMNSLRYSSLSDEEKEEALTGKWQKAWDMFINITKEEACSTEFTDYEPLIGMILPREGANTGTTPVHIYGRNFTRAICRELRCKFGDIESPRAMYISNNHIICEAPDISYEVLKLKNEALRSIDPIKALQEIEIFSKSLVNQTTVPILVDFGDGNFTDIGKTFTYKYDPLVPTTTSATTTLAGETGDDGIASNVRGSFELILLLLTLTILNEHFYM